MFSSSNSGLNQTALWYFGANIDPLLLSVDGRFSFFGREVYLPALYNFEEAFPFDSSSFQQLGSGSNFSYKKVWDNVSKLAMTYDYRFSNPTSKIGISRQIFSVYDESLGLSMPVEKFLVVLAK